MNTQHLKEAEELVKKCTQIGAKLIRDNYTEEVFLPISEEHCAKDGVAADILRRMSGALAKQVMEAAESIIAQALDQAFTRGRLQGIEEAEKKLELVPACTECAGTQLDALSALAQLKKGV